MNQKITWGNLRCEWCHTELVWGWYSVWNNGRRRYFCGHCGKFVTHDYTGGTLDRYPDGRLKPHALETDGSRSTNGD